MKPRPLWRWWLFCACTAIHSAVGSPWALRLMAWCVLPAWLGHEEVPHG